MRVSGNGIKIGQMFWKVDSFFSHILIPLSLLTLYFVLLFLVLPYGVNRFFVSRAGIISLILAAGFWLIFFVFRIIKKDNHLTINSYEEKISASDLILILLPLTPVIQYILNNQDILSPMGSLYVLAVFVIFSAFFIIVIPALFRVIGSANTLKILGLTLTFTITNMVSLSAYFHWYNNANFTIQLLFFGAIFLVSLIIYKLIDKKLLYFLVIVYFLSNSIIQLSITPADSVVRPLPADNKLVELVNSRKPLFMPNIYLLLYDAYVTNDTMLQYGIDNSAQEKYLEKMGFKLYPYIYSLGALSIHSMSRVLNASAEFYGNERKGVSGDGIIQNLLKGYGYETFGVFTSDYFFWGIGSRYDYSFPEQSTSTGNFETANVLVKAIYMGEFRFDVVLHLDKSYAPYKQFLTYKSNLFRSVPTNPRFVYVHTPNPGHSQDSGACRPNETELFRQDLILANAEMKTDIETIIQNDPNGIIIVAGDHGPYLTKNCTYTGADYDITEITRLDIQDRFASFLAIKWPTEDFSKYDDITVLQDIFPAVFAYLYKNEKLLEAKVDAATRETYNISGAFVKNGIIHGGKNDGEPLFLREK
jgi:hypothetical protein